MATLSEATVQSQLKAVIQRYEQTRLFGAINAASSGVTNDNTTSIFNFVSMFDNNYSDNISQGDLGASIGGDIAATRATLASIMNQAAAPIGKVLRHYGQVMSVPELDSQTLITRLTDYFILNGKFIGSRGITFGSITNGSPKVGDGTVYRLVIDENGYAIENCTPEVKTFECIADATSGARGRNEEIFEVRGASAQADLLKITGSGVKQNITTFSAASSFPYLRNPSFSQFSGTTTVPTDITSWTSSVTVNATNYQFITDTYANQGVGYYRDFPGDSTSYSIQCLNNAFTLSQSIEQFRNSFDYKIPYFVQVAYKKSSAGTDGTLTLTLGNSSAAVTLGGIGDTNWHTLQIALGSGCWFRNFDKANLTFSIARSGGSTGNVTLDDIILTPFVNVDGIWHAIVGGATNFLRRDLMTVTDSEAGEGYGVIQKWFWRAFGRYLPSRPAKKNGGATWGAGCSAAQGAAGNVEVGTHNYAVTLVDGNGVESYASANGSVVVGGSASHVSLTAIITGAASTNITARKIYRTKVASGVQFFLLTTISDNVTTTYDDNTADASLGARMSSTLEGITTPTIQDPTTV
jgi:hypothetical protein